MRLDQGKRERIKTALLPINISAQYTVYVEPTGAQYRLIQRHNMRYERSTTSEVAVDTHA